MLNGPTDLLLLPSLPLPFPFPFPAPLCVSSELAGQVELSLRMPRYKMHLQQIPRVSVRLTCPVNPLLASLPLSFSLSLAHSLVDFLCLPYDKFAHCSAELMMSFCLVFCFGCQPPAGSGIRVAQAIRVAGTGYQTTDRTGTNINLCVQHLCEACEAQSRSPPNESRAMMLIAIVCRSLCSPKSVMSVVSV